MIELFLLLLQPKFEYIQATTLPEIASYYVQKPNVEAKTQEKVYDYSECQYPMRETNQNGRCDNTDPACPETIKFGYDCVRP